MRMDSIFKRRLTELRYVPSPCRPCPVVTRGPFSYFGQMQLTQDEIIRLSPDERLSLIAQLWDSLEDHQVQETPAKQAELDHRRATLGDDRGHSITWEALKAELEQRCP